MAERLQMRAARTRPGSTRRGAFPTVRDVPPDGTILAVPQDTELTTETAVREAEERKARAAALLAELDDAMAQVDLVLRTR